MILSCIKRIEDKLGYNVGIQMVGNVLRGSRLKRILELKLEELTTYGLMKDRTRSEIHGMIDHLEAEGYLQSEQEFQTVSLTASAAKVLYQGEKVMMKREAEPEEISAPAASAKMDGYETDLFDALKELRGRLAREAGIPAHVMFSNATLMDMARKKPRTTPEFRRVSGVGEIKAAWYAEAFLKCIREFEREA